MKQFNCNREPLQSFEKYRRVVRVASKEEGRKKERSRGWDMASTLPTVISAIPMPQTRLYFANYASFDCTRGARANQKHGQNISVYRVAVRQKRSQILTFIISAPPARRTMVFHVYKPVLRGDLVRRRGGDTCARFRYAAVLETSVIDSPACTDNVD